MIFNIQKCSIHDGVGLRTLVFFKGCPLHCLWCANPESQSYDVEIMENPGKCIGCGACLKVCPHNAIQMTEGGPQIHRSRCRGCMACVDRCYAASKYAVGREYGIEELYEEINKDSVFYSIKGGGVTFSGGEPLSHPEYLTQIARVCRERGINIAVESCGVGDFERFKEALPYIDSMFLDIKHIDSEKHRELTGRGNKVILQNIRRINEWEIPLIIRTPIIPGYNDSAENVQGIAKLLTTLSGVQSYELLPYHEFGKNKYASLGRAYALQEVTPPAEETIRRLTAIANGILMDHGKHCFYTKDNTKVIVTENDIQSSMT